MEAPNLAVTVVAEEGGQVCVFFQSTYQQIQCVMYRQAFDLLAKTSIMTPIFFIRKMPGFVAQPWLPTPTSC